MAGDLYYDDMVFLYRGNGGFVDESNNGYTITPSVGDNNFTYNTSGVNPSAGSLFSGTTALQITNSRGRIGCGAPLISGSNNFTVEAWVYTGPSGTGERYIFFQGTSGTDDLLLYFSHLEYRFFADFVSSGPLTSNANAFVYNTWTHVAWTRSGSTQYLFINGVLHNTRSISGSAAAADSIIGAPGPTATITGYRVKDLIVYNKAMYTSSFTPRNYEVPAYQLNDKLIPRKDLHIRKPLRVNGNNFIHRVGI